ncbi:autophagy protein [Borealophlyctis nickersoniae]|nr:autophagy protein [Borealophlyctis nickersoniae]
MVKKKLVDVLISLVVLAGSQAKRNSVSSVVAPALCALSPSSENCFLAYPPNTSGAAGELLIFDAINLQAVNILQAHKSPLSCIAFNYDGTMVATSSDKGTVIRVFSVPTGQKLYQFRRGTYPARIYSITFNLANTLLSVSSDTDTVHVFKLLSDQEKQERMERVERRNSADKKYSLVDTIRTPIASAAGAVSSYFLPDAITEMWEPTRDFAFAKLPTGHTKGLQNICAISGAASSHLMVVTAEGYFYQYSIDLEAGGECNLLKQYSLVEEEDGSAAISP